jgi:hypothetical protein
MIGKPRITAAMWPSPHVGSHTEPMASIPKNGRTSRNRARDPHNGVGKKSSASGGSHRCAMTAVKPLVLASMLTGLSGGLRRAMNRWPIQNVAAGITLKSYE